MLITKKNDQFDKKVHKFEETKNFLDLMNAIEFALKHRIYDCSKLLDTWTESKANIEGHDLIETYSHILPSFSVCCDVGNKIIINNPSNSTPRGIDSDKYNDFKKAISNFDVFQNELKDRYEDKYAWFRPSWWVGEMLSVIYTDEVNPGVIIAEHLRMLFPKTIPVDINNILNPFNYNPRLKLPENSILFKLISDVGVFVIDKTDLDNNTKHVLKLALDNIFEGEVVLPDNIFLNEMLISILFAPRDFFYSWIYGCWFRDDQDSKKNPNLRFDLQLVLNYYSIGYGNYPICNSAAEDYLKKDRQPYSNIIADIKSNKYVDYESILSIVLQKYVWQGDFDLTEDTRKLLIEVIGNYSKSRKSLLSGASSIGYNTASLIVFELIDRLDANNIDLTLLLSSGDFDSGYLVYDESQVRNIAHLLESFQEKEEMYLVLYHKAIEEGLHELGNALLSLYLVMRAIQGKLRFGDMSKICKVIDEAINSHGSQCLKYTIKLIVTWTEQHYPEDPIAQMVGKIFRNYLPQEAKLHVLQGKGENKSETSGYVTPERIKEFYIERLEKVRWEKLSEQSKQYLLDAETTWRLCHMEFCFNIKDWSGLIMSYCNVIETELVERLAEFYCSDDLKTYLEAQNRTRPGKATTGWLLKELENHDKFPVNMKELLKKSKTTLYHDKNLLKSLASLNNYRNIAAHKDPSDSIKLAKFKQIYFENQVIHRFIDALS